MSRSPPDAGPGGTGLSAFISRGCDSCQSVQAADVVDAGGDGGIAVAEGAVEVEEDGAETGGRGRRVLHKTLLPQALVPTFRVGTHVGTLCVPLPIA